MGEPLERCPSTMNTPLAKVVALGMFKTVAAWTWLFSGLESYSFMLFARGGTLTKSIPTSLIYIG